MLCSSRSFGPPNIVWSRGVSSACAHRAESTVCRARTATVQSAVWNAISNKITDALGRPENLGLGLELGLGLGLGLLGRPES